MEPGAVGLSGDFRHFQALPICHEGREAGLDPWLSKGDCGGLKQGRVEGAGPGTASPRLPCESHAAPLIFHTSLRRKTHQAPG